MPNADHAQRVELRTGQEFPSINGFVVRKTTAGLLEVISPANEFIHKPQTHTVEKGASFGMTYFREVNGQQVAHTIIFS